jgi:putative addiction module CopG family antidote
MTEILPPDLQQYVRQQLEHGVYRNEEELLADAVRALRERNGRLQRLRDELRQRLGRVDRGESIELEDDDALEAFYDDIEREVDGELTKPG